MRTGLLLIGFVISLGLAHSATAEQAGGTSYKGIWISTPFPAFSTAAAQTVTLDLKVHNAGLPPQAVKLDIEDSSEKWRPAFLGDGKLIGSVFVAPDSTEAVKLRLEPRGDIANGAHHLSVVAESNGSTFKLPITLDIGKALPPKLTLQPELPTLRGSPDSDFEFKVAVRNDGGQDATVKIDADVPEGFRVRITEDYGSQELTSFPLKVAEEKTIKAKVSPGYNTPQGEYPITLLAKSGEADATTQLSMEVTGQSDLLISGIDERLNTRAEAGEESPLQIVVSNNGSAPAQDVKLSASPPSGWKVKFEPGAIEALAPDENRTVQALITPSDKAVAGDYMVTVRAETDGANKSTDFRVTVHTSTMWGIVGAIVIAAALVVLVAAMLRYGRR